MTDMNRRDFVRFLAVMAAGAAALPEQISTFEKYYDLNTYGSAGLAAVDEVMISGMAGTATPVALDIMHLEKPVLVFGCNLYGGILRWVAAPDQKIVAPASKLTWRIATPLGENANPADFRGHISYIDQGGIRQIRYLDACKGTLA